MRRKHVGYSVLRKKHTATNATIRRLNVKPFEGGPVRVQTAAEATTLKNARHLVAKLTSKDVFVRDAADTEDLRIVGLYELDNVDEISHIHMARLKKVQDHITKGAAAKRLQKKAAQWKVERGLMEALGFGSGRLASSVTKQEHEWLMETLTPPPSPRWLVTLVKTPEQAKRIDHRDRRTWETAARLNACSCCPGWDKCGQDRNHRVRWRSEYARHAWTDEEDYADEDAGPVVGLGDKTSTSPVSLFDFVSAAMPESADSDYDFCDIALVAVSLPGALEA